MFKKKQKKQRTLRVLTKHDVAAVDQAIVHRLQELQERTKQSANSKYGDAVHTFAPTVPPPSLMHKDPPKSSGGMFSFFKSSSSKSSHGTNILKAQAERQEKENQKLREKTGYSEKEEKQRQAISHAQFKAFGSEMKDVVAKKQEITSGNQRLASALKAVNGQGVASPAVFINGKPQPPPGMPARISNGTPTQTQPVPTTTPTPISNGTEPASTPITTVATTTSPTTPAPTATATGAPITIVATPTPADVKPTSAEPEVAKASTPTSVSASVATEPAAVSAPAPTPAPAPAPAATEPAATATATATATSTPTVNTAAATTSPASASPTSASTSTSPSASSSKPPLPPTPAPSLPPSQQNMSDKKSATPIRRSSQSPAGSSPIPSSSQISPITSQPTSPIVTIPPISTNGSHNGISRTSTPSPSLTPAIDDETDVADDGDPESVSGEWEEKEVTAEIEQELETQRERVKTILLTQDDDDDDEEDEYEMDPYSGPIYAQPLQRIIRIRRITRKKRTSIFPLSPSFFAIPTSPTSTSLPPLTIPPAMSSQSSSSPTSIDEKPSIVSVPIGTVGANKPAMPSYGKNPSSISSISSSSSTSSHNSFSTASLGPHDDAINTATHHAINQIHTHIINAIQQQYIRIIPLPLIALSSYILKHGMNVEGIFRIPGDSGEVQQLKSVCDTVASNMAMWPELDKHLKLENYSVHSVAGAFKLFFRQLPEPLLTYELYTPLLHAYEKGDPDGLVALVYHQLKQPNLVVLRYLLTVLTLVSMGEKFNKMSATNLAIVFAPNILRPKMETQQSIMMDTKKCIGVLTMILDDHADANNILSPVAVHMNAMLTAQASSPSSISSPRASTKPTASSPVGAKPYQPSSISSTASSIRAISPSSPSTSPTNTSPSSTSPTAGAKPYQPSSISSTSSSLTRPGVKLPPNAGGQVPIGKAAAAVSIKK